LHIVPPLDVELPVVVPVVVPVELFVDAPPSSFP
jgi:hypothetical protein